MSAVICKGTNTEFYILQKYGKIYFIFGCNQTYFFALQVLQRSP